MCVSVRRVCLYKRVYSIFVCEHSDLLFGPIFCESPVLDEDGSALLEVLIIVRQKGNGVLYGQI